MNVKVEEGGIGYVFEDYEVLGNMNVYKKIRFMSKGCEDMNEVIDTVKIEDLVEKYGVRL
ncbi:P-loop NTPase family protein [Staphylococcus epidermidis]|uniref:hypothetical protein n=1 Tax=Staphylococcus epidermidis TaxID=1282 RepID=UPI0011A834ED|nr:hypothetical protein [Staphylococcus epidermidis]